MIGGDRQQDMQAAKFQVEYYFGQTNYLQDDFLQQMEGPEKWIDLVRINKFNRLKRLNLEVD